MLEVASPGPEDNRDQVDVLVVALDYSCRDGDWGIPRVPLMPTAIATASGCGWLDTFLNPNHAWERMGIANLKVAVGRLRLLLLML